MEYFHVMIISGCKERREGIEGHGIWHIIIWNGTLHIGLAHHPASRLA